MNVITKFENDPWKITGVRVLTPCRPPTRSGDDNTPESLRAASNNTCTQLQHVDHTTYQIGYTISIEFSPWKLISNTYRMINNMLFLEMARVGMWSFDDRDTSALLVIFMLN